MSTSAGTTPAGFFPPTIWSTICKAQGGTEEERQAALERLLGRYRKPILKEIQSHLPGNNRSPERAEDFTQEFLCQCLRPNFLKKVREDPENGSFRRFVKVCIAYFLRDQHKRESAKVRNPGQAPRSLDETDEEGNRLLDPAAPSQLPGNTLDRQWALTVLDHALATLRTESKTARQGELFEALRGRLGGVPATGMTAEISARLGMSMGAVNVAFHRMRIRLGELISEEVRQTLGEKEDWRNELKYLVQLLAQG